MSGSRRAFCVAVASVIGVSAPLAGNAEPSETGLCDQLAAHARTVTPSAWNGGGEKALQPVLEFESQSRKPSPLEVQLAGLSWVKEAIGADGGWTVFTERLTDSDIYMASTVQGTLHCQFSIFVEAKPGEEPRPATSPMELGEEDVCWTVSGDFGLVFGKPAFIVHGALNDHTDDEDISIVPKTGGGWGKMCKVELRFRKVFTLTRTFCGNSDICGAGKTIAVDVAKAYNVARAQTDSKSNFEFGPPPTKTALDSVRRATAAPGYGASTPAFPTFGATSGANALPYSHNDFVFSYNGFTLFPLTLTGKNYVGALGHYGLGWRESGRTLFAIYSERLGALTPLAGFEINQSNGGLISAAVQKPN
jgi:hypothetical protein